MYFLCNSTKKDTKERLPAATKQLKTFSRLLLWKNSSLRSSNSFFEAVSRTVLLTLFFAMPERKRVKACG
jgi:hypothetical protein